MPLRRQIIVATLATLLLGFASFAQAQRGSVRVHQGFRYLGHFQTAGYHWRTPGPCVDYYNPYSQHNSALRIGGTPQGAYGYHLPSFYQGNSQAFDHPSNFNQIHSVPFTAPGNYGSNTVDSVIDDSEPVKPTNADDQTLTDEQLQELESEVQSILNDSQNSNSDQATEKEEKAEKPDETSLWPGFKELGNKNRNIQGTRYPVRPSRTAKRFNG